MRSVSEASPTLREVLDDDDARAWLVARIEIEARALANAELSRRAMIAGRLHGFLEVGTRFGWWSRKSAVYVFDMASHRMAKDKVARLLRR